MKSTSFLDRLNSWARNSVTLKLFIIGILILFLLIPAAMLSSLIYERENLRDGAIREVSEKWGLQQTLAGPVISVPYETARLNAEGKIITTTGYAHFLPDTVAFNGNMEPQKRYRGIYVVVLYNTKMKVSGDFGQLNAAALSVPEEDLHWEDALFTFGISDMKGVENSMEAILQDSTYNFGPGTVTKDLMESGASFPIDLSKNRDNLGFSFELDLNGSSDLFFAPFGKITSVNLQSPWSDPGFEGAFLPDTREVNENGFQAQWNVLQLNRSYPQQGQGSYMAGSGDNYDAYRQDRYYNSQARGQISAFGVRLLLPIDEYQKTMRSAKYASIFIIITFLTFFFIEVLNQKRLHPIQYLLVGTAIILFYVLLLSISEQINFNLSYLISCVIILVLVTFYAYFILRSQRLTMFVAGILAILYGFFYSLLQLQDYALLLGSLGLLLILSTIMYLTRNIDWYNLKTAAAAEDAEMRNDD
ncbi:MAG: cell envelope integrity protein CreD [Saprospiraceae bacterium]|nr:MAG: cell envelope integrity protein CreD [Saprospiraceae bacterium]